MRDTFDISPQQQANDDYDTSCVFLIYDPATLFAFYYARSLSHKTKLKLYQKPKRGQKHKKLLLNSICTRALLISPHFNQKTIPVCPISVAYKSFHKTRVVTTPLCRCYSIYFVVFCMSYVVEGEVIERAARVEPRLRSSKPTARAKQFTMLGLNNCFRGLLMSKLIRHLGGRQRRSRIMSNGKGLASWLGGRA